MAQRVAFINQCNPLRTTLWIAGAFSHLLAVTQSTFAGPPRPDHVVVVVEENHSYGQIIGSAQAPYINSLASAGASFTQSFGIEHPSQPNYLDLFSGSNQGVTSNTIPSQPFTTPNLAAGLTNAGYTFAGYSEDLPAPGSLINQSGSYFRKHNPWSNWQGAAANAVAAAANQPFSAFPTDFSQLPTVSFVVPNQLNDMHDGTIGQADAWLQTHIATYVAWATTHNSLLILTWDEDDGSASNRIPTIFVGPMVNPGTYSETINHFNVLRTIEDMYGLTYAGASASATPILDVWSVASVPEPGSLSLMLTLLAGSISATTLRSWRVSRRRASSD